MIFIFQVLSAKFKKWLWGKLRSLWKEPKTSEGWYLVQHEEGLHSTFKLGVQGLNFICFNSSLIIWEGLRGKRSVSYLFRIPSLLIWKLPSIQENYIWLICWVFGLKDSLFKLWRRPSPITKAVFLFTVSGKWPIVLFVSSEEDVLDNAVLTGWKEVEGCLPPRLTPAWRSPHSVFMSTSPKVAEAAFIALWSRTHRRRAPHTGRSSTNRRSLTFFSIVAPCIQRCFYIWRHYLKSFKDEPKDGRRFEFLGWEPWEVQNFCRLGEVRLLPASQGKANHGTSFPQGVITWRTQQKKKAPHDDERLEKATVTVAAVLRRLGGT